VAQETLESEGAPCWVLRWMPGAWRRAFAFAQPWACAMRRRVRCVVLRSRAAPRACRAGAIVLQR
jgi:hypothetical protein